MNEVAGLLMQAKRLSNLTHVLDISWGYIPKDLFGLFLAIFAGQARLCGRARGVEDQKAGDMGTLINCSA